MRFSLLVVVGGGGATFLFCPFPSQCLTSYAGSSELWADAALGAASSAVAALATQPVDTVKTRVMTKR